MGFWIFMLIMSLLIPITMIGFGRFFIKRAPQKINMVFGYRTSMSMKNNDTWKFAHTYFGRLWCIIGWVMLPVSICAMLLVLEKEITAVGVFGGVLVFLQCIFLFAPFIPTERELKKTFDKHGNRIVKK